MATPSVAASIAMLLASSPADLAVPPAENLLANGNLRLAPNTAARWRPASRKASGPSNAAKPDPAALRLTGQTIRKDAG